MPGSRRPNVQPSWNGTGVDLNIPWSSHESDPEDGLSAVNDPYMADDDRQERQALLVHSGDTGGSPSRSCQTERPSANATTYEDALLMCGFGRFHLLVLLLCGWAVSSDAIEVLSISFLLPSATCDLSLSDGNKGLLNSIVFVGMMIGGYVWGSLSDKWGRRNILIWSLLLNGLGNLGSSAAQTFTLFIVCRLVSGIGVGGSMPVVFTYYTEFQHKERRGSMISLLATFWMAGNIIAAGLAWIIIPREYLSFSDGSFTYHSWRVYVAMCTIPSLTSALLYLKMPESPKFLLQMGREEEAIHVLKKVHGINRSTQVWKLDSLVLSKDDVHESDEDDFQVSKRGDRSCCERFQVTMKKLLNNTLKLFRKPFIRTTLILLNINFTLAFGYYGLFLWFPELFNRIEKYGGSFCDLKTGNDTDMNSTMCEKPANSIFLDGFLTSVSNLPGNIITIFLVDRIGRKAMLSSSMTLSGVTVFFLYFVKTRWQNVLISCLFGAISVCGFNMLDILLTELFPTDIRSTAFGVQTAATRVGAILGNVVFGELVNVNCAVPMFMVASLLTWGGLTSLFLPNTTRRDIH